MHYFYLRFKSQAFFAMSCTSASAVPFKAVDTQICRGKIIMPSPHSQLDGDTS